MVEGEGGGRERIQTFTLAVHPHGVRCHDALTFCLESNISIFLSFCRHIHTAYLDRHLAGCQDSMCRRFESLVHNAPLFFSQDVTWNCSVLFCDWGTFSISRTTLVIVKCTVDLYIDMFTHG